MDALEKRNLYDRISEALTNWENLEISEGDAAEGMYGVLVEIQNSWDELITEED